MPDITFYDWAPSPFCFKVRAILAYKDIPHRRVNPLGAPLLELLRKAQTRKVPALSVDGEMLVNSTDIAYELERLFPGRRPIIPKSAIDRARCHALEDWADKSLYFMGLYYQWFERDGSRMVPLAFGKSLLGRAAYLFFRRRIIKQLRGQGTSRKSPEHVRRDLERHLDAIDTLLRANPFLLGDRPYLCDFALLGQLVYLARTPVGGPLLSSRTAIEAFRQRMKGLSAPSTGGRVVAIASGR